MITALVKQASPQNRVVVERSIAATAGALFGIAFCGWAAMMSGRMPFTLDLPMLTLYSSAIPLSVAGFMGRYANTSLKRPMLATLWFLALFVPTVFFSEALFGTGTISLAGMSIFLPKLVGFRLMLAAAVAGAGFAAIRGGMGAEDRQERREKGERTTNRTDWETRHREAIRRLAMVDVEVKRSQSRERRELDAFERRLRSEMGEGFAVEEVEFAMEVDREHVAAIS